MRMTIFGATGPTGRQILAAGLAEGHTMRAFARQPEKIADFSGRVEVVEGDALDREPVARAVAGADAVISALGTGSELGETTVMSDGTKNIVAAMQAAGVRRLVVLTSGLVKLTGNEPFFVRTVVKHMLRHVTEDHRRVESVVEASQLDWTIVRPPRLIDDPARGTYRLARNSRVEGGTEITRADLAHFLIKEAIAREYLHTPVMIGH